MLSTLVECIDEVPLTSIQNLVAVLKTYDVIGMEAWHIVHAEKSKFFPTQVDLHRNGRLNKNDTVASSESVPI